MQSFAYTHGGSNERHYKIFCHADDAAGYKLYYLPGPALDEDWGFVARARLCP